MALTWVSRALVLMLCLTAASYAQSGSNFTIVNGQIYTPGLAIVDAPQPFTPLGGDFLQVAIDISGNGKLPQPYYPPDGDTGTLNITMFLFSYNTLLNMTISNGTGSGWRSDTFEDEEFKCGGTTTQGFQNAGCQEIMAQESGSTVKHVNWAWPDCLVGIDDSDRDRGSYNISIHQSFRINGTGYYTIFNLPIQVTNSIPQLTQLATIGTRPLCSLRQNPLQNQTAQDASTFSPASQPYLGGTVSIGGSSQSGSSTTTASATASTTASPTTNPGLPSTNEALARMSSVVKIVLPVMFVVALLG
ncbi:hypothetical protein G647_02745 [Cladophialophora carrionii CBS 160.54]|uniref:Ubiquitin 3 binding protein But2 C-terminal domain-containing protein n=1 Tax=Cladophialophora carrionii CBS 160.54 TaxID=1279043 RepID=V9DI30_9EURO|nr:uncharacterized protein G647_02745 [Cladophialophora carrionii CBS 160.54]ETI25968.1 hypothetical protein G647_02745 [Cladophialophora carrionii CBS 160.54]